MAQSSGADSEGERAVNRGVKRCRGCAEVKSLDQFSRSSDRAGYRSRCKQCRSAASTKYYFDHHEEQKARKRLYRKTHIDQELRRTRLWAEANPELVKAFNKGYYERNKRSYMERAKDWAAVNRDARCAIQHRYNLRYVREMRGPYVAALLNRRWRSVQLPKRLIEAKRIQLRDYYRPTRALKTLLKQKEIGNG